MANLTRRSFTLLSTAGVLSAAKLLPGCSAFASARPQADFFPYSTHVYREPHLPLEQLRHDFPVLKRLGFTMIKIQEVWAYDELHEGQIDLSNVSQVVSDARQNGLHVYFGVTMENAPMWLWKKLRRIAENMKARWILVPAVLSLTCTAALQAQTNLANAAQALGTKDYDRAREILCQVLLQQPNSAHALFMMADLDMQTDRPDEAVGYFERGLRIEPKSFPGHYELALAFLRRQKWNDGLRELRIAVQLDPQQPDAVYNLALVLLETGHPREALARLRQANELAPGRPDLSYNMARAELSLGHSREAIQELVEADRRQPNDRDIHRLLAQAYLQSNQPREVTGLLQPPASAEDYFLLATAALAMGQVEQAAEDSASSLAQSGEDVRYLLLNARIDQQRSRQQAALETLDRAARLAPGAPEILYSQAVSYYFLGQYERVRQSLDRLDDGHMPLPARALFLYAMSYENEGKPDQAIAYLQKAVALEPGNARFQCHLGVALLQKNQNQAARHAFTQAVRLDPAFALPHFELGKMLAREKQFAAAAQELEFATRIQPDLAPALYELSRVYGALGRKQPAAETMARFLALKAQETAEQEELASDANRQLQSP